MIPQETQPTTEVLSVDLSQITDNPNNPRAKVTPLGVQGLADSIASVGLLQLPVVVRTGPESYELRAGHRRVAALRVLEGQGLRSGSVDVCLREDSEGLVLPLEIALAENGQREGLDAFAEAAALAEVLRERGGSLADAATRLGRSPKWVARRANLLRFSPAVRELLSQLEGFRSWPPAWLEEIALLAPSHQADLFLDEDAPGRDWANDIRSIDDLRAAIRFELRTLAHATWELDSTEVIASLDPAQPTPACSVCPMASHNLSASSDLFGDLVEGDAAELASAVCTDGSCYDLKAEAVLRNLIRSAQKKHGAALLIEWGAEIKWSERRRLANALEDITPTVRDSCVLKSIPKKNGGRPTLALFGKRLGKISYRLPYDSLPSRAGTTAAKPKPTIEDRVRSLAKRRTKALLQNLCDCVSTFAPESELLNVDDLLRLVLAFGTSPLSVWDLRERESSRLEFLSPLSVETQRDWLWPVLEENILNLLKNAAYNREPSDLEEGRVVSIALGLDWMDLLADAAATIPVPKGLSRELDKEEGGAGSALLLELFPAPTDIEGTEL